MSYKKYNAWLLLTIIYSNFNQKGASLNSIISSGDAIMHAIFNIQEINEGISWLLATNFIEEKNNLFFITNKTEKLYSKINRKYKTIMRQLEEIEKNIKSVEILSSNQMEIKFKLSEKEYTDAVKQYTNSVKY